MDSAHELRVLRETVQRVPEGVVAVDADGVPQVWNPSAERILGAAPSDRCAAIHWASMTEAGESPVARALRGEVVSAFELPLAGSGGETRWIEGAAAPLSDGGAVALFRDETKRRQHEAQRRLERRAAVRHGKRLEVLAAPEPPLPNPDAYAAALDALLEAALHSMPGRLARLDVVSPERGLECLRARERAGAPAGASPAGLGQAAAWVVERARPIVVPDSRDDPFASDRAARAAYVVVPVSYEDEVLGALGVVDEPGRAFTQDDESYLRALAARAGAIVTRYRTLAQLGALNDELTRHRDHLEQIVAARTAELELTHRRLRVADRLASIGTLTAGLGHDMNNILFPLRCRLDQVNWETVPDSLRETLDAARDSSDMLRALWQGLRLFALDPDDPGAAGDGVTRWSEWLGQTRAMLDRFIPDDVTFTFAVDEGCPDAGIAAHRMTQVVLNLVVNAAEATREGQGSAVGVSIRPSNADEVAIRVVDDGAGISDAAQLQIFDPLYSTKKRGVSTGLGLSIVHRIVTSAGGTIDVDSAPGEGSRFTIRIPAAGETSQSDDPRAAPGARVTVLDPRRRGWIEHRLRQRGVRCCDDAPQLWVTDFDAAATREYRAFVEADDRHRLVVLAPAAEDVSLEGAILIQEPDDLGALDEALDCALGVGSA